jgi:hypothetical protein
MQNVEGVSERVGRRPVTAPCVTHEDLDSANFTTRDAARGGEQPALESTALGSGQAPRLGPGEGTTSRGERVDDRCRLENDK